MRPENQRMTNFLMQNGIKAKVKFIWKGSSKGLWRLSYDGKYFEHTNKWTPELQNKLTALGFTDFDGQPLHQFSGNGGMFCVFVRGHRELLED